MPFKNTREKKQYMAQYHSRARNIVAANGGAGKTQQLRNGRPIVIWTEELPEISRTNRWLPAFGALISNPGRWAIIYAHTQGHRVHSTASNFRSGKLKVPGSRDDFEFATRKLGDAKYAVYARYVGT